MDRDTKLFLGKLLGEIYQLQHRQDPKRLPVTEEQLYGLLHGFEWVVDEHLDGFGDVTTADNKVMVEVLNRYFTNPEALKKLKGFYDIEAELEAKGVDRFKAISLLRYFRIGNRFTEVLDALDTSDSPMEVRGAVRDETER